MGAEGFSRRAQPWLGTLVEIAVPPRAAALLDAAFGKIAAVHRAMSFHSEDSDLARLRRAAPGERTAVSAHTVRVLRAAQDFFRLSGGLFDVTIGAELVAWGFLPRPAGWKGRARGANSADIEIIDDRHVRLKRPLLIDLGGIAKGYAVDAAVAFLETNGAEAGLVNAGGDLRAFGGVAFSVAVRAADWSGAGGALTLADGAMATSANAANRKKTRGATAAPHVGGERKPALFNDAVTVFAPSAMHADALTKVVIADAARAAALAPRFGAQIMRTS